MSKLILETAPSNQKIDCEASQYTTTYPLFLYSSILVIFTMSLLSAQLICFVNTIATTAGTDQTKASP